MYIASYPTKKAFKEAVRNNPDAVYVDDPSPFNPVSGSVREVVVKRRMFTVTNHPKRSWFAQVELDIDGKIYVS